MPDILLRDIDGEMAERIKEFARERGWPLNDTLLHLIRHALGMAGPDVQRDPAERAAAAGHFEDRESQALEDAMEALKELPDERPF